MDLLTDILNSSGLRKRLLNQQALYVPWALNFPCPMSIGFHVVTQGEAYLWTDIQSDPIPLKKGDIAFAARGTHHYLSTHSDLQLIDENRACNLAPPNGDESDEQDMPLLSLVCGAYQLWNEPIHPIFKDLPDWHIIRAETINFSDSLQNCLQILSKELTHSSLGSEAIIGSLLDVMLNLILRRILCHDSECKKGWAKASQDPVIGEALQLMHGQFARDWSVESLAHEVGISRAGFASKFKQALGDTPLHYLTILRISKAMEILGSSDKTLEKVAHEVGYRDAFSFSKTFKKQVGLSPRNFRIKNKQELELNYRFEL